MKKRTTSRAAKKSPKKQPSPSKGQRVKEPEGGPAAWLFPLREGSYSKLVASDSPEPLEPARRPQKATARKAAKMRPAKAFASVLQPDKGEEILAQVADDFWITRLAEYKQRKSSAALLRAQNAIAPMPAIAGANNWIPLGPSVVARGQAATRPAIGGRTSGIAVALGGSRIYAATAVGGVWRSDDAGRSWRSCMDGFDTDPLNFASASLACGAIAIDLGDPNRIYVGTGEGDTDALFAKRLTFALPSYRGIGAIRSDDGGQTWLSEPTDSSSPTLAGAAFFALAVDPGNRENVVGATTNGLYQRVPAGAGAYKWVQRRTGNHCSVVVAQLSGTTRFFAAAWGGGVFTSTDGITWSAVGTGFPTGIGRVSLAVQSNNPNVVYAYIATTGGGLHSVRRLDGATGPWKLVSGVPASVLPGQGDYNLPIAIDPNNANRIYLGGNTTNYGGQWTAAIHRCDVTAAGSAYTGAATYIGANAHSDVHVLILEPGNSNNLWTGTDGGVFQNTNPGASGVFASRNTGLACLCPNYFAQHPSERALLFCGLQDNGTARYTGEECWRHVLYGDGGYCIVNWANPFKVLVYANGWFYRASDGGQDYSSWTPQSYSWLLMAEPMVGPPYNPSNPAEADIVAVGVGTTIHFSSDFGATFPAAKDVTLSVQPGHTSPLGSIYSMVFASGTRLFVGTTAGRVFRVDFAAGSWTATEIDNATLLITSGMVSDIAVDWSDPTRSSIYIAFGGNGDFRHVWRYDGTNWSARSGPAGGGTLTNLLDVEHNAIVVDPDAPTNVYVGADIGVWYSSDNGNNWTALENGLPDAPVFDLQIHRPSRLLRASLHGRGLFEWKLDLPVQADVELYIRDTMLDTGRGENTDWHNDPSRWPIAQVVHYESPNIKVDVPTPAGYQTPTNQIDFFEFNEVIVDGSQGVGTIAPGSTVHNRVYVEVHNRGRTDAASVQVMAAITNASAGLGSLPAGYAGQVTAGIPINDPNWTTLGTVVLTNLRAGFPQIAAFDLPSTVLPVPASLPGQSHYCLVAFLHSAQDVFSNTQQVVDILTVIDRKVGQKNLHIVEFIGVPPPGASIWTMLDIAMASPKKSSLVDLVVKAPRFRGGIDVLLPKKLYPAAAEKERLKDFRVLSNKPVKEWVASHSNAAQRIQWEGKYSESALKKLNKAMELVAAQPLLQANGNNGVTALPGITLKASDRHTIFLRITPPKGAKVGDVFDFNVEQRDSESKTVLGGSAYRVVINRSAKPA
jgi:hypothetical protein